MNSPELCHVALKDFNFLVTTISFLILVLLTFLHNDCVENFTGLFLKC